jgi:hypothetical protein
MDSAIDSSLPQRPEYVPEAYWTGKDVDVQKMSHDLAEVAAKAREYRQVISRKEQEMPKDPSGYNFSKLGMNEKESEIYGKFAHSLGLSAFQAEKLFGEEGEHLTQQIEELYKPDRETKRKEYIQSEIEKFGGEEKVRELGAKVERLKTSLINKGAITEEQFTEFKEQAMSNANGLKVMANLLDNLGDGNGPRGPVVNQQQQPRNGKVSELQERLAGLSAEEMVMEAKNFVRTKPDEMMKFYESLNFLNQQNGDQNQRGL